MYNLSNKKVCIYMCVCIRKKTCTHTYVFESCLDKYIRAAT